MKSQIQSIQAKQFLTCANRIRNQQIRQANYIKESQRKAKRNLFVAEITIFLVSVYTILNMGGVSHV
jgi:hypothetical protein